MAENVTQTELDKLNSTAKTAAASSDETKTYEGKFIGTLIGQATTAQELAKPYNFTLSGDVTGSASVNAGDLIMPVTVNHSAHADTSDFAGKTQLANRSNVADMANTAEFAYRAGKIAKIIINLTGVVTGKGESTNSESVDIEVTDFDASKQFVVGALATEPDTSKVYIDVAGKHLWIYDNTGAVWVDCFKQLADELDSHNLRIEALERFNLNERVTNLEGQTSTLEEITADHESRITTNKKVIDNHELRLNNIETTTDLGQVTLRITAIEEKNKEQDTSLEANATAIAKEVSDREQAINTEAKAREDADNALGVRIDNADAKNTEQDTALDTAKNELTASIGALSQKLQANLVSINERFNALAQVPTGTIIPFAGATIPNGYLLCNGVAISRTDYAVLFGVIATLYGVGDGSTTFNLPDLRDRFLEGAGTNALATYLEAGLPNITGTIDGPQFWTGTGAFVASGLGYDLSGSGQKHDANLATFNASLVNSTYSKSNTVQPNATVVQYLIKY